MDNDDDEVFSYDMKWQIMLRMDPEGIQKACNISQDYMHICKKDSFWKQKIRYDFGGKSLVKLDKLSIRETYFALHGKIEFTFDLTYYELGHGEEENNVDFILTNEQEKDMYEYIKKSTKNIILELEDEMYLKFYYYFEYSLNDRLSVTLFSKNFFVSETREEVTENCRSFYKKKINGGFHEVMYDEGRMVGTILELV